MQFILAAIARIRGLYDWASFLDAIRTVLETKFGLTVVSALIASLVGAWTEASGYQIALMGVGVFLGTNAYLIHRHLKKPGSPIILSPIVSVSQEGPFPAKYIQV